MLQPEFESQPAQPDPVLHNVHKMRKIAIKKNKKLEVKTQEVKTRGKKQELKTRGKKQEVKTRGKKTRSKN